MGVPAVSGAGAPNQASNCRASAAADASQEPLHDILVIRGLPNLARNLAPALP
jgi:hypothetical protein